MLGTQEERRHLWLWKLPNSHIHTQLIDFGVRRLHTWLRIHVFMHNTQGRKQS